VAHVKEQSLVDRLSKFLFEDLWEAGIGGASRMLRAAVGCTRVAFIAAEGFWADLCLIRASALTYTSLLGLVPVLAIAFAFLRGMGWEGERLETYALSKIGVLSPEAIKMVVSYIDNTSIAGLGVIGGSFLVITFISVMATVEGSFNAIWGDVPARPFTRKIGEYVAVLIIAPVLLAVATSLNAAVQSNLIGQWLGGQGGMIGETAKQAMGYSAYATMWLLFAFIYMFMPNTKVRLGPALIGGVLAGSAWQLTQWGYIHFQIGMGKYNAIYGAMAQLPILMVWLYISWVIVLAGAEIAYAVQSVAGYSRERRTVSMESFALREYIGLAVVAELARASIRHTQAVTFDDLAAKLDVPVGRVHAVVKDLIGVGLVRVTGAADEELVLAFAPDSVTVDWIVEVLRGGGKVDHDSLPGECPAPVKEVMRKLTEGRQQSLAELTARDLAG